MTKIVYNGTYGGFGLSHEGVMRYAELKGIKLYVKPPLDCLINHYYTSKTFEDKSYFRIRDISRVDPSLVATVEELKEAANGPFASLEIRDLPVGTKYRIDEYDGMESVITFDEYEWETA